MDRPKKTYKVPIKKQGIGDRFVEALVLQGVPRAWAVLSVQRFLELVAGHEVKPLGLSAQAVETTVAAQAKPILHLYRALYGAKYHEEPMLAGDDFIKVHKLLQFYGPQQVTARLNAFFAWDDPWVEKCGRTIQTFYKQWNKLATVLAAVERTPIECRHEPLCLSAVGHSQKLLAERKLRYSAIPSLPHTTLTRSEPS